MEKWVTKPLMAIKERFSRWEHMGGGLWRMSRSSWAVTSSNYLLMFALKLNTWKVKFTFLPKWYCLLDFLFLLFLPSSRECNIGIFVSFLFVDLLSNTTSLEFFIFFSVIPTTQSGQTYSVTSCLGYCSGLPSGSGFLGLCSPFNLSYQPFMETSLIFVTHLFKNDGKLISIGCLVCEVLSLSYLI